MLTPKQQKAVLISTILASSMAFIDSTALNVALPALQEDLNMSGSSLLWVVNGYALFLSALLLIGGSLGDQYGRKRVFLTGITVFTISSALCGLSTSPLMLIISRCIQGIGGALMVPGSLAIISALFGKEKRGWAIGTWSMFSAMTTVFGPVIGGWLAGQGLWRMVFFINIPLAIISAFFLIRDVPETERLTQKKLDLAGALLAILALGGITYGFIEAPNSGFSHPTILIALMGGGILFLAFLAHEHQAKQPMMPLPLFQSKVFTGANLITLFVYGALGGFLFFFPLNLIQVQGYPAELAGLTLLPFGLLIAFLSRWSGALADKIGTRIPLIIGPMFTASGFFIFSLPGITAGPSSFWNTFLPPMLLLGIGMGITVAPLTTAVMNAVPYERTGTASGVNNTVARTAGVLAIAIMGALGLFRFEESLTWRIAHLELNSTALMQLKKEVVRLAEAQPPEAATKEQQKVVEKAIKFAFIDTFKQSALIASILSGISVFIAYFTIPGRKKQKIK
ncbi:hypothetical protein C900_00589 [Fulvivirga imtechensis AK7]|uniref:Major facilitator superfamily (MFS) profile domain-containing protein n=1 Tax=Fulvivirga imtechensis AK7 TaxID=1237149 RepID=L8JHF6_9BACT|nr:MFS transporter [Fulvivirga imtechensis]ELR68235.1 hypothetical protein C900_00589 [Fulvivirga imtechensis AK7]